MKIISVIGARPNFMKIAPFIRAISKHNLNTTFPPSGGIEGGISGGNKGDINHILVHTGQHYDDRMSQSFFDQLEIPQADINLGIGSGSHAEQVGKTMIEFEKVLKSEKPDWVVVVGDVNAILACSVTAKKENIKCCHIEAGLRSGDMSMPEEINRLVADRISDLLLTPDLISSENLRNEGVPEHKIRFVGNIMIDTLEANRRKASLLNINEIINHNLILTQSESLNSHRSTLTAQLSTEGFAVMTLHRPSNVDRKEILEPIVRFIQNEVCSERLLIWTLHPRTMKMLEKFNLFADVCKQENLILLEPLSYLEMLRLNMGAKVMLTDSGGLQEECTILGTPCLTLRWNTERPVTLLKHGGVSVLVGNNIELIRKEYLNAINKSKEPVRPELWDGKTAERCLEAILKYK
jgi:UDP-N-acetylglucosamine 2-epimerase (non-hydrolysing)